MYASLLLCLLSAPVVTKGQVQAYCSVPALSGLFEVMSDHPVESVAVSFASQPGSSSDGTDGQRSDIRTLKKSWSAVTTSVKCSLADIWVPLGLHVVLPIIDRKLKFRTREWMGVLVTLVPHMILCLTSTFLLPISILMRKLILTKGKIPPTWERIPLVISLIGLAVDPFFFYIPFIDEKSKCIGMEKTLRAIVLALRSLTDLVCALHSDAQIHEMRCILKKEKKKIHEMCILKKEKKKIHEMSHGVDSSLAYHSYYHSSQGDFHSYLCTALKWLQDIIIEFLPILFPIPQVIIGYKFFRMKGSEYLYETEIGNVLLILQFIVRGYQIYYFRKAFKRVGKWTKGAFYFLIYILVGHVLGAFWYFLSIQREMSCWHQTCRNITGCLAINYCKDTNYSTNITLLDEFCPINPSNATLFDFGIFLDALKSGNTGSKSFPTKYFYTFWWGIRNLSNFGTNLETSNYLWENFFTILISLVGLLLFIYLMGKVQTYILWETEQALEYRKKKIESNYKALQKWMDNNGIPKQVKTEAVKIIRETKVVEKNYDVDVDLDFVFNTALADNEDIRNYLRWHLCLDALQEVGICGEHLQEALSALKPVVYKENSYVVQAGEPDDRMLIIIEGVIVRTSIEKTPERRFEKGDVYGKELLMNDNENLPIPKSDQLQDVKCEKKVEAFALSCRCFKLKDASESDSLGVMSGMPATQSDGSNDLEPVNKAYKELTTKKLKQRMKIFKWLSRNNAVPDDLQTSVKDYIKASNVLEKNLDAEVDVKYMFSIGIFPRHIQYSIKKQICINSLRKVRILDGVDKDLLRGICMFLEPLVLPEQSPIFDPHSQIDRMLIVVEGEITVTKMTSSKERGDVERIIKKRDVIGEELLTSAPIVSKSSNSKPATLNKYVDCSTKVEAFALTKEGWDSVCAYYRDGNNSFKQLEKGRDGVADTQGASRSTTTIDQRLDRLIQLQSDMAKQHRDEMANLGRRLDEMAAFLFRLGCPAGTSPPTAA